MLTKPTVFSSSASVSIPNTGLTEIEVVNVNHQASYLVVEVENTGAAAADAFQAFDVQVKAHYQADWAVLKSSFGTADAVLLRASADPAALAGEGAKATLLLFIGPVFAIRFRAQAAEGKTAGAKVRGVVSQC